jgi:putative component of membrane protein insertase Oxa1/YidC/SpoIIIJ protein YidD
MMPGMYPKRVSKMFSQKCHLNPTCKNTPSGGNRIARRILKMSAMVPVDRDIPRS